MFYFISIYISVFSLQQKNLHYYRQLLPFAGHFYYFEKCTVGLLYNTPPHFLQDIYLLRQNELTIIDLPTRS